MSKAFSIVLAAVFPILLFTANVSALADSCDDARAKLKNIWISTKTRHMMPEEQKHFVEAACSADDEERARIMDDAGHRVESTIMSHIDKLKQR